MKANATLPSVQDYDRQIGLIVNSALDADDKAGITAIYLYGAL